MVKIIKFIFIFFIFIPQTIAYAQNSSTNQNEQDLVNQIRDLESKISKLQSQEKTLSTQIAYMDDQMKITALKIDITKKQIVKMEENIENTATKISKLDNSLDNTGLLLLKRIDAAYRSGRINPLELLLTSRSLSDLIKKSAYLRIVEEHDKKLMLQVQMSKDNFTEQKQQLEDKQKKMKALQSQLESYTKQLTQEEKVKKDLLSQTQGSETNYQRLLSAAKSQLAGFTSFVQNQGGASLLSNQTSCNSWGCYYNQRDSAWGSQALNHTQYTLASDGCLVTSMAMVVTHYGHKTLPPDINGNPSNFASYYPAYLLYTISVNGITASRIGAAIDSILSQNNPVIVGVHAYGGTHFVVLISGSSGNYKMHDPYISNGHDISFSDHYSLGSVFEINRVEVR